MSRHLSDKIFYVKSSNRVHKDFFARFNDNLIRELLVTVLWRIFVHTMLEQDIFAVNTW